MNTDSIDDNSPVRDINKQQAALSAQLASAISTMHHIDELLQWLSSAVVRNFDAQLVQCWANHINTDGRLVVQLRALARQDTSFPEHLIMNEPMKLIAQRVIGERRSYKPQPIETLFPPYQTVLLKRYGMYYCSACFTSRNALLPQGQNTLHQEQPPVLLAMSTILFLRQFSHPDLIKIVNALFEQAAALAEHRGLLTPHDVVTPHYPSFPSRFPQQETASKIDRLIPRRKQDSDLMLAENPFANNVMIADKQIQHFYAAIDGHTNVAMLSESMGATMKETYETVRTLLKQNRIELYEPDGQTARNPLFPDSL